MHAKYKHAKQVTNSHRVSLIRLGEIMILKFQKLFRWIDIFSRDMKFF